MHEVPLGTPGDVIDDIRSLPRKRVCNLVDADKQ